MKVCVKGVSFAYSRKSVLCGASLELVEGGVTVVGGPSGSGKTTLLKLLAGLLRPAEGSICFDGEDVTRIPAKRRDVGVVLQSCALSPFLNVRQNLACSFRKGRRRFSLRTPRRQPSRHATEARVWDAAALLGLERLLDRRPSQLSSGERQRVALARALAPRPALLLLDEPFSSLDTRLRRSVRRELTALLPRLGTTVLWVSQDQETLLFADQVAVLDQGRVVQAGSPLDLYRRPATPAAAFCLGEASFVEVAVEGCDGRPARTPLGRLALPPGPLTGWLLVRPEDVKEDPEGSVATVLAAREVGPHDRVVLALGDGAEVVAHFPPESALQPGTRVRIGLRCRQPHFLSDGSGGK